MCVCLIVVVDFVLGFEKSCDGNACEEYIEKVSGPEVENIPLRTALAH